MTAREYQLLLSIDRAVRRVEDAVASVAEGVAELADAGADSAKLAAAAANLRTRTQALQDAVAHAPAIHYPSPATTQESAAMANVVVQQVLDQVKATDTVIDSATALINGFGQVVTDAVNKAIANGATQQELAPVTDALAEIRGKTDALAKAVVAGAPAANP